MIDDASRKQLFLSIQGRKPVHLPSLQMGNDGRVAIWIATSHQLPNFEKAKRTHISSENACWMSESEGKDSAFVEHHNPGRERELYRKRYLLNLQHAFR